MVISITTSEIRKLPITYLAEIDSVSMVTARVDFFCQVLHKEIGKNESVSVYNFLTLSSITSLRSA